MEFRCYQQLGSFPKLTKLSLELDYMDSGIAENYEKNTSRDLQIERMRVALINSAMDEHLAYDIFCLILGTNRAIRPVVPSFQRLKLLLDDQYTSNAGDFGSLQSWIGKSWVFERRYADINSNEAWIEELGVRNRMMIHEMVAKCVEEDFRWSDDGELYRQAWEANWPEAKGRSDWIEEWHSFPVWQDIRSPLN